MSITDTVVLISFLSILAFFIIGFNKHMMQKHQKRVKKSEKTSHTLKKETIDE